MVWKSASKPRSSPLHLRLWCCFLSNALSRLPPICCIVFRVQAGEIFGQCFATSWIDERWPECFQQWFLKNYGYSWPKMYSTPISVHFSKTGTGAAKRNIKGERVWCCGFMITGEHHANVRLPAFTKRVRSNTRPWWLSITFHTGKSLLSEKRGNLLNSAQKISSVRVNHLWAIVR